MKKAELFAQNQSLTRKVGRLNGDNEGLRQKNYELKREVGYLERQTQSQRDNHDGYREGVSDVFQMAASYVQGSSPYSSYSSTSMAYPRGGVGLDSSGLRIKG